MKKTKIYFAGGIFGEKLDDMKFEIVHPNNHPETPYITHNPDGLKTTAHHASLYTLTASGTTAVRVKHRSHNAPERIALTDTQVRSLKNGILIN